MGIQASIICDCYPQGKTTPCPYPDVFVYDPSAMPALNITFEDMDEAEEVQETFLDWLKTCCAHPNMEYAREFIASWRGYRQFVEALEQLGEEDFPLLYTQLPEGEDGITPPELATPMLEELSRFEARQTQLSQTILFDDERQEVISMGSDVLNGTLALDRVTGYDLGFDADGFFIRDRLEFNRLLFRAHRVEQRLLHPEIQEVEYQDLDGERSFRCRVPFGMVTRDDEGLPRMNFQRFSVQQRPTLAGRFDYITLPLRRILEACSAIQHPIRWH